VCVVYLALSPFTYGYGRAILTMAHLKVEKPTVGICTPVHDIIKIPIHDPSSKYVSLSHAQWS
jgi:hypothetical protein